MESHDEANVPVGGHETILVVEDDRNVRALVCSVLKRFGYRVLEADSGRAALEIWQQQKSSVNLVITDLILPDGVTGQELAQKIIAAQPATKIVYTSGYGAGAVGPNWESSKNVRFLQKPFSVPLLTRIVRECLDGV